VEVNDALSFSLSLSLSLARSLALSSLSLSLPPSLPPSLFLSLSLARLSLPPSIYLSQTWFARLRLLASSALTTAACPLSPAFRSSAWFRV